MLFTKTPGFRITEIQLQSCKNLVDTDGKLITFRITSLFNGQKLEIKNCTLVSWNWRCSERPPILDL